MSTQVGWHVVLTGRELHFPRHCECFGGYIEMQRVVHYLCLQATRQGQASHAHVHEIIRGLRKRGWNVRLFEPSYANAIRDPSLLQRMIEFVRVQVRLWLSGRPDILYVRSHFAAWPTAVWARLRNVPVIQEINGTYEDLFLAWPWTRRFARLFIGLIRSQLRWADAVITVTPQLAKWVREEGISREVYMIPNGANTELFSPDAKDGAPHDLPMPYVIFFGALAPWQGVDTMLAAVEHPDWPSEVTLLILGDGVERPKVEEVASRCSRVQYWGLQPYTRLPRLITGSLAALSVQSAPKGRGLDTGLFPLKLFESLACGVPVIVSDIPGMADLIRAGRCGLVIPPDDPEGLAKAVRYLYSHPEECSLMGKRGRELVEHEHSWDRRAQDTSSVLERILASSGW